MCQTYCYNLVLGSVREIKSFIFLYADGDIWKISKTNSVYVALGIFLGVDSVALVATVDSLGLLSFFCISAWEFVLKGMMHQGTFHLENLHWRPDSVLLPGVTIASIATWCLMGHRLQKSEVWHWNGNLSENASDRILTSYSFGPVARVLLVWRCINAAIAFSLFIIGLFFSSLRDAVFCCDPDVPVSSPGKLDRCSLEGFWHYYSFYFLRCPKLKNNC